MKKNICLVLVAAALIMPVTALAQSPTQTVKTHINQLLDVLRTPAAAGSPEEEHKKEAIRDIAASLFDFSTLSRFTLGRNWRQFDEQQKKTFTTLYRELLESIYMGRLLEYKDEKVVYKKETALGENRSEVLTSLLSDTKEVPVLYRMVRLDGHWKVYDLIIENVSLVKNYREQFRSILSKESPDGLIKILREKVQGTA
jgi:phospholipid transport system substrate-binding protein